MLSVIASKGVKALTAQATFMAAISVNTESLPPLHILGEYGTKLAILEYVLMEADIFQFSI